MSQGSRDALDSVVDKTLEVWMLKYEAVYSLARELAAEHLVGNSCTACRSFSLTALGHKEGCPVKKLEAFQ